MAADTQSTPTCTAVSEPTRPDHDAGKQLGVAQREICAIAAGGGALVTRKWHPFVKTLYRLVFRPYIDWCSSTSTTRTLWKHRYVPSLLAVERWRAGAWWDQTLQPLRSREVAARLPASAAAAANGGLAEGDQDQEDRQLLAGLQVWLTCSAPMLRALLCLRVWSMWCLPRAATSQHLTRFATSGRSSPTT
jgi:hypothetical protein